VIVPRKYINLEDVRRSPTLFKKWEK